MYGHTRTTFVHVTEGSLVLKDQNERPLLSVSVCSLFLSLALSILRHLAQTLVKFDQLFSSKKPGKAREA